jgi:hypothetical protein
MSTRSAPHVLLPAILISCLAFVACDARHETEQGAVPDPVQNPAQPESAASLEDADLNTDTTCGGADQLCCGSKRAQSLKALEKRCRAKNYVCPQGESEDYCEPCGKVYEHCCVEKGKAKCKDGSSCERIGEGGPGIDAYPGICLPAE